MIWCLEFRRVLFASNRSIALTPWRATPGTRVTRGLGRPPPRRERDRLIRPSQRRVRCEGDRSRRARRSRTQTNERNRSAPLEVHERRAAAAPLPELIAQQRPPAPEDERAVRRQVAGCDTELHS